MEQHYIPIELNINNMFYSFDLCKYKDISEPFKCIECQSLPINPKSISDIDALICQRCISIYQTGDTKQTPNDMMYNDLSKITKNTLHNLILKCPNTHCKHEDKYQNIYSHLEACQYTPRTFTCKCCNENILSTNTKSELVSHLAICTYFPESCIYCQKEYLRRDISYHSEQCDEREFDCEFCELKYTLPTLESHRKTICIQTLFNTHKNETNELRNEIIEMKGM
jgi:hypothetical protein